MTLHEMIHTAADSVPKNEAYLVFSFFHILVFAWLTYRPDSFISPAMPRVLRAAIQITFGVYVFAHIMHALFPLAAVLESWG